MQIFKIKSVIKEIEIFQELYFKKCKIKFEEVSLFNLVSFKLIIPIKISKIHIKIIYKRQT